MSKILYIDTDGTKGSLPEGHLGYDKVTADRGRVAVGTNTGDVLLAKKSEVDAVADVLDNTAYTVETIEELINVPVEFNIVIVKDLNRGGIFVSKTGAYTINDGTVFAKSGGGYWVRHYSGAVSVKWFGARGDSITDDTVAIQKAINYVIPSLETLFFPAINAGGVYKISSELVIDRGISIQGENERVTIMASNMPSQTDSFIFRFAGVMPSGIEHVELKNLTLRTTDNSCSGIQFSNTSVVKVSDVVFYSCYNDISLKGERTFSLIFDRTTHIYTFNSSVIFEPNFTGGGQFVFTGCSFSGKYSVFSAGNSNINNLSFNSCNFESNTINSVYIESALIGLNLYACRFENLLEAGRSSIYLNGKYGEGIKGITISCCTFNENSYAAVPIHFRGGGSVVEGYSITDCDVSVGANTYFLFLNGTGDYGFVSGVTINNSSGEVVSAVRNNLLVINNKNTTGSCTEHINTSKLKVYSGTFTPTFIGTVTAGDTVPTTLNGNYAVNNNLAIVNIFAANILNTYTIKPSGNVRIANLPFVAKYTQQIIISFANTIAVTKYLSGMIVAGTNYIDIFDINGTIVSESAFLTWDSIRDPYGDIAINFTMEI